MQYRNPVSGATYQDWQLEEMAAQAGMSVEDFVQSKGLIDISQDIVEDPIIETEEEFNTQDYSFDQYDPQNIHTPGTTAVALQNQMVNLENISFTPPEYNELLETKGREVRSGEVNLEGESNIEHTGSVDEWIDELGMMAFESDAVDYLSSIYPSNKVRFEEAGAGDNVEVLIGDQKPGEGQQWNLSFFSNDDNVQVFNEIENYIKGWGNVEERITLESGDLGNTEELGLAPSGPKSISLDTQPEDYAKTDKTKLIEKLTELLPEEETGFKIGYGREKDELGYGRGIEIIAPNGAKYFQYAVSESSILDFVNENSYSKSGRWNGGFGRSHRGGIKHVFKLVRI